ncbi:MAG: putative oxidoreductase [Solirubrobacteraceae bacterium]|jgi:putative oxidoreductase|nr:putative oxidoreductase [Solirubrobacteraceae bacterium]
MELGLLVLRLVVGVLFMGHGAQKLWGYFGGHGIEGTGGFFEAIGLKPGRLHARAAGFNEFAGGLLLALGLFTPFAAALLIATMVAAIVTVHWQKGVWSTDGGYEYNLVLMASAFAVACIGAGPWSLDGAFNLDLSGAGWGLAALAAGVAGGFGAVAAGRSGARRTAPRRSVQAH